MSTQPRRRKLSNKALKQKVACSKGKESNTCGSKQCIPWTMSAVKCMSSNKASNKETMYPRASIPKFSLSLAANSSRLEVEDFSAGKRFTLASQAASRSTSTLSRFRKSRQDNCLKSSGHSCSNFVHSTSPGTHLGRMARWHNFLT